MTRRGTTIGRALARLAPLSHRSSLPRLARARTVPFSDRHARACPEMTASTVATPSRAQRSNPAYSLHRHRVHPHDRTLTFRNIENQRHRIASPRASNDVGKSEAFIGGRPLSPIGEAFDSHRSLSWPLPQGAGRVRAFFPLSPCGRGRGGVEAVRRSKARRAGIIRGRGPGRYHSVMTWRDPVIRAEPFRGR